MRSTVVATRVDSAGAPLSERMFSFLEPFSAPLWILVILMVTLSGCMDYADGTQAEICEVFVAVKSQGGAPSSGQGCDTVQVCEGLANLPRWRA